MKLPCDCEAGSFQGSPCLCCGAKPETNMNDDIDQQDQELERGDEPLPAKPQPSGFEWWPEYHDDLITRHRTEAAKLKALNWALDRIFK